MIGYILTEHLYNQIQGQEFAPFQRFNCVQDIHGTWFNFVSNQQVPYVEASQYAWLFDLPQGEFIPPLPTPFPYETN